LPSCLQLVCPDRVRAMLRTTWCKLCVTRVTGHLDWKDARLTISEPV
jgi:hypothetical protein